MKPRFYVDFNDMDDRRDRVIIWDHTGLPDPLNSENMKQLYPGLEITLYDLDQLEVDGTAFFDEKDQHWYGIFDTSTWRDVPLPPEVQEAVDRRKLRLYVDYNDLDKVTNTVAISDKNESRSYGNGEHIKHLRPGLAVTIYDATGLQFDGVAEFDEQHQCWYVKVDPSTRRDPPDEKED